MLWVLFALGASIVNALYYMCLQNIKLKPHSEDSLYGLCYWCIFITSMIVGIVHLIFFLKNKYPVAELTDRNSLKKNLVFYFYADEYAVSQYGYVLCGKSVICFGYCLYSFALDNLL